MPKIIELSGVVGVDIKAKFLKNKLVKDDKNIIKVDSEGGSVFEGNRLYNLMNDSIENGIDIDIQLGVLAASASSYWPLAVGSDRIKVRDNTVFVGHKAWSIAMGNADDLKEEAEVLDGFDMMIAKVYSKVNSKTIEENLEAMGKEFWLMGGQAVVDAGFASGIIESDDTEIEGVENRMLGKPEVQARIKEAKATLRANAEEEDLQKWAAKLKEPVVNKQGQIEMFQNKVDAPQLADVDNNLEADMDFKEYLDLNPEAQAEQTRLIDSAKAEAVQNALKEERERSSKIAKLYGNGDMAIAAINEGTSVGDLAVAEKENALEAIKESGKDTNLGTVKVQKQVPEDVETEETKKETKAESVMDKAIDNLVGKDKKEGK